MNLYEISVLENEIEKIAEMNDGEINEEQLQALVVAQTTAIDKLDKCIKYIKHLEQFQDVAKSEEKRIYEQRKRAEKLEASIKAYITTYVASKGKVEVGTFKLSTRKSVATVITDEALIPDQYKEKRIVEQTVILKDRIKQDINWDIDVPGAILETRDNLQIK